MVEMWKIVLESGTISWNAFEICYILGHCAGTWCNVNLSKCLELFTVQNLAKQANTFGWYTLYTLGGNTFVHCGGNLKELPSFFKRLV